MAVQTFDEFMARYNPPNGTHPVTEIESPVASGRHESAFVVIRHGLYTAVINPLAFDDHLCLDVHSFVSGQKATAGMFGMVEGYSVSLPETGTTSHGWPSSPLAVVILGKQG